jgi:hypothetical protein
MRLSLVILVVLGGLAAPPSAFALCVPSTEQERMAWADVIFEGTALEGSTETGVQRFRVSRYLKSGGPEVVSVQTGRWVSTSGFSGGSSISINVEAGTEWRIFGRGSPGAILDTNTCLGSKPLPLAPLGQEPPRPPCPGIVVDRICFLPPRPEEKPEAIVDTFKQNGAALVRDDRRSFALFPKVERPRAAKKSKAPNRRVARSRRR